MKKTLKSMVTLSLLVSMLGGLLGGCASDSKTTATTAATTAAAVTSEAQTEAAAENESDVKWPEKAVKFVIPWAAGGATDIIGRAVANAAEKKLNQPVVVENREGGSATIGTAEAAMADGDGYTVLVAAIAPTILQPHYIDVNYSVESFKGIGQISEKDMLIVVKGDSPYNTMEDLIAACKEKPDSLLFSVSKGNAAHLAFLSVMEQKDFTAKHYPSKGDNETVTNVLGGIVDFGFLTSVSVAKAQIEAGEMKALALFSEERSAQLPDVPTLKEQGIDVSATAWTGLLVPASTPDDLVKVMQDAFEEIITSHETEELLTKAGENLNFMPGDEFMEKIQKEYEEYGVIIQKFGLGK